jgi:Uma2 family endonuclease
MDARADSHRCTTARYLSLTREGLLSPDDRVELLDGIIVAMPPHAPLHAYGVRRVQRALAAALGRDILVSVQLPIVAGPMSVPEPDLAVLPGREEDYMHSHPTKALLVVEVAESSLPQDRLTKTRIYSHAGIPEYWIVNLRDHVVEWFCDPDVETRVYRTKGIAKDDARLPLVPFPAIVVTASMLLPPL